MKTNIQLAICIWIFPTLCACQRIKCKKERWISPWLFAWSIRQERREALRRGKQRLPCAFMVGCIKSQCERTSLYIAPCDMNLYYAVRRFYFFHTTRSYKAYILHTNQSYIFKEQFLLLAPMTTYLMDLIQSIGRYCGLLCQDWFEGIWKHK